MLKQIGKWLLTLLHNPNKYAGLRKYSIFKNLNSFELYLLNNHLHLRNYKSGDMLFDKDYPLEVIFFIEKGEILVSGKVNPKQDIVLKKHQFLGMMDMFYENIRSSSAKALSDVKVLAISRYDLMDLINKNPHTGVKILTAVCQSFSHYIFDLADEFQASLASKNIDPTPLDENAYFKTVLVPNSTESDSNPKEK
ncbi:MAG: Crp/Fnr family transcriptional regulator [Candidatus Cloacimonetes bacterium]|nr:Crp/Fnr family transcriptional regulator [Candidatus Cloacimonadota bacterium]